MSMAGFIYYHEIDGHGTAWADIFLWVRASARIVFDINVDFDHHYKYSLKLEEGNLKRLIHGDSG